MGLWRYFSCKVLHIIGRRILLVDGLLKVLFGNNLQKKYGIGSGIFLVKCWKITGFVQRLRGARFLPSNWGHLNRLPPVRDLGIFCRKMSYGTTTTIRIWRGVISCDEPRERGRNSLWLRRWSRAFPFAPERLEATYFLVNDFKNQGDRWTKVF
jgi:hypothetical protein